jgi:hypothetical protein
MSIYESIKLTPEQIREIEIADSLFRSTNLKEYAERHEHDLLTDKFAIFSTILFTPRQDKFRDILRLSVNKNVKEDNSNGRLFNIEDLKYPPDRICSKLNYNRASYKNQSIFYGGFGPFQTLFENSPSTGDLFTVSTWRQKENTTLSYVSIFQDEKVKECSEDFRADWDFYLEHISKLDPITSAAYHKLLSLITFFFILPVDPSQKIEYLFSAHIANKIFFSSCTPSIEAILYPSVKMRCIASNIAILPRAFDEKFYYVGAEEYVVLNKTKDRNQWTSYLISKSNKLLDNKLIWNDCTQG